MTVSLCAVVVPVFLVHQSAQHIAGKAEAEHEDVFSCLLVELVASKGAQRSTQPEPPSESGCPIVHLDRFQGDQSAQFALLLSGRPCRGGCQSRSDQGRSRLVRLSSSPQLSTGWEESMAFVRQWHSCLLCRCSDPRPPGLAVTGHARILSARWSCVSMKKPPGSLAFCRCRPGAIL